MVDSLKHTSSRLRQRILIILSGDLSRNKLILNDPKRGLLREPLKNVIRIVLFLPDRKVLAALTHTSPAPTLDLLLLLLLMMHLYTSLIDHHLRRASLLRSTVIFAC